ncbi:group 3 secretory phospholipase A2-like isoform X1 [Cyprinodon tularosa]|uniref:group 3 secretory phospholipase A2-like isoform X1 n=1 Tax=Cyprinodon tularosa TaxID=77115 RepID=UPI0018E2892C|nr:group 3 secretory phospholipase A2-like isoform X1 [Cyprinodon tularosa]
MTSIPALLALSLTSALLSCSAAQSSIRCIWTKVSPNGQVHVSFLRGDPLGTPLRLYHSVWSGERALSGCTWSDDAALIQSYASLCRGRTLGFSDRAAKIFDLDSLLDADECVSLASPSFEGEKRGRHVRSLGDQSEDERSEVRIRTRVKRGFIVPGTLWCGSGNKAPSYADLGVFSDTDSCCREHDQCKHTILSFQSEFGVFNSNIFTMSHCDCDNKFRSCLRTANDSIADVVGYTFFNLLKMHCFTFSPRLQCAERNWFGMCKKTQMALYADVHSPTQYESARSEDEGCMNGSCSYINSTAPAELQETNASDPRLLSTTAATSTVPTASSAPSITDGTNFSAGKASMDARESVTENNLPARHRAGTQQYSNSTEEESSCTIYKELDECKNKILPQQRKYGLHNTETKMLYHCNCTAKLFHTVAQWRQLSKEHVLLLRHVAKSCFLPQDCAAGSNCTAVLVKAEPPQLLQRNVAQVEQQRHLQIVKQKVRRPEMRKEKREDRPLRLYRMCLRMTRPKQMKKTKKRTQNAQTRNIQATQVN